jgi:hypothetical protein
MTPTSTDRAAQARVLWLLRYHGATTDGPQRAISTYARAEPGREGADARRADVSVFA